MLPLKENVCSSHHGREPERSNVVAIYKSVNNSTSCYQMSHGGSKSASTCSACGMESTQVIFLL